MVTPNFFGLALSLRENSVLWCFFDEPHVEGNFNQTESIEKHKVEIYVTIT